MTTKEFDPDWRSPPGDTIRDIMEERGICLHDLADQLQWTVGELEDVLAGVAHIGRGAAPKLAQILGGTAEFWLSREAEYRRPQPQK